jgi:hypothetical protein
MNMWMRKLLVSAVLMTCSTVLRAQDAQPVCPAPDEVKQIRVSSVFRVQDPRDPLASGPALQAASAMPRAELRQAIGVKVEHLDTLLQLERCSLAHKKVVLYLDGRAMPDLRPYPAADPGKQVLYFQLLRTEGSRDVWTYLLGKPRLDPRKVEVSVGMEDMWPLASTDGAGTFILLDVIPGRWLAIWSAVIILLLAGCIGLGGWSGMLRDRGGAPMPVRDRPFSLARVQLATWTFLILGAFLFIGLITGDYTTSITSSVLALMGISAGTAAGSSIIDANPRNIPPAAGQALPQVAVVAVAPSPAQLPQPQLAALAAQAGAAGQNNQLVQVTAAPPGQAVVAQPLAAQGEVTSGHWWLDIVSDRDGVNFHRFQMAAWTIVLGIVFIKQVYSQLAMPDFDSTLLGLIGISSGTYLGMKITER